MLGIDYKEIEGMKKRFMRRLLAKGVILTSLTAPTAACVVVIGDHPGDHDPRVMEFDSDGNRVYGIRDDGSELGDRVADHLRADPAFAGAAVKVYADNGKVTLVGQLDSTVQHQQLVDTVRAIPGVDGVVARLAVSLD